MMDQAYHEQVGRKEEFIAHKLQIARQDLEQLKKNMAQFQFSLTYIDDALNALESVEAAHRS
jgi:prefoldin subunit 5